MTTLRSIARSVAAAAAAATIGVLAGAPAASAGPLPILPFPDLACLGSGIGHPGAMHTPVNPILVSAAVTTAGTAVEYVFDRPIASANPDRFGIVSAQGNEFSFSGGSVVRTGQTVTVFPPSEGPARPLPMGSAVAFFVRYGAAQSVTGYDSPEAAFGHVVPRPVVTGAVHVPGRPGVFDVTFDHAVFVTNLAQFALYGAGSAPGGPIARATSIVQTGPTAMEVSFGTAMTPAASDSATYLGVGNGDSGGVMTTGNPNLSNIPSGAVIASPPLRFCGIWDGIIIPPLPELPLGPRLPRLPSLPSVSTGHGLGSVDGAAGAPTTSN